MMTLEELMGLPCSKNLLEVTKGVSYDCQIRRVEFVFHEKDILNIKDGDLVVLNDCMEPSELIRRIPAFTAKKIVLIINPADDFSCREFFDCAKQCGLPVLQVTGAVSFYDLIQSLCQEESREAGIRFVNTFLNRYGVNEREGLFHIVKTLEQIIKMPVFVFDCDNKLIVSGTEYTHLKTDTFEQVEKQYKNHHILEYGLGSSGNLYIVCKTERLPWECEEAVKSSLLALAIAVYDYRKVYEENRNKFIYDILKRKIYDDTINKSRLNEFGLDPESEYFCIAIDLKSKTAPLLPAVPLQNTENRQGNLTGMDRALSAAIRKRFQNDTIVMADDQTLLIFWPIENKTEITKKTVTVVVKNVIEYCGRFFENNTVTIGISSVCSTIVRLNIPYHEAVQALQLGSRIFGPGTTTHFDDLSMYRILLEMDDIARIDRSLGLIDKIIEYDQNNNTDLMRTLEVYYGSNFNLKETAQKLFLHYNSIQYRLKKISEITDLDITSSDGVFTMMVGMKLKHYSK